MFAKRSKQSSKRQPPSDGSDQSGPSGPDARDATIERLERELAEQRETANTLRASLDAATFKTEILEKSYATQLAEARDKLAATESDLAGKEEILANLGGGHEHTLRELNDALAVIKVLKADRDKLRKQIAHGGFRQRTVSKARALLGDDGDTGTAEVADSDSSGGTINALIANAGWAEQKPGASAGASAGRATAQVESAAQQSPEEMLSPDLVFTAKDKENAPDDER